ncbi:MAG: hypothetical protein WC606_03630 [Candidatus Absconditabacterales bacterium]
MKKYLLLVVFSVVFFGCAKNNLGNIDVNAITDLSTLQGIITQVSEEINAGTISMEHAQELVEQLQQKYVDLTDTTDTPIETKFAALQKTFDEKAMVSYTLPLWAKKLGMSAPKGMVIDKTLSKQTIGSTILVYKGNYDIALQQAEFIAQKAHLYVSKNFQQAQSLAKIGNVDYISGLDIGGLRKGIVYVNHELLDTNIDNLLSVSVDQDGVLTIEATKYQN